MTPFDLWLGLWVELTFTAYLRFTAAATKAAMPEDFR